jgi:hypothetical protein
MSLSMGGMQSASMKKYRLEKNKYSDVCTKEHTYMVLDNIQGLQ